MTDQATSEERIARLEERLQLLEDERELRDLMTRYSFTADLYRGQPWVDLWTPDGVYDLGTQNAEGGYSGRFEGSEQLLALITGEGMPPAGRSQHHVHGPVAFQIDGDRAVAEGYSVTYVLRDEGTEIWTIGFSRWIFQRVDGRWKIHERQRRELGAADQTDVIASPAAGRGDPADGAEGAG
ncbi:MAG TPA: nuclear transport factor 2 family protein [Acidimicrobiales bacterium]|nr:nuclear transport factor 2 family protein [Acidimicrobiales bacterium]